MDESRFNTPYEQSRCNQERDNHMPATMVTIVMVVILVVIVLGCIAADHYFAA